MQSTLKFILTTCTFFIITLASGQVDFDSFEDLNFRNIGPAGMSGRVTAIDVDLSNPSRIFIGSASGGVWLSENAGISWEPIFDDQPTLSIGSIKINQQNPSEIWVGTGEGNPRNSVNTGKGIYKSVDGGKTWMLMGLESTKVIHRILIDHRNGNTVYAGAMGSPWGDHKERGLYKTTDGGQTWEKILYANPKTGVAEMVMDPTNPNKLLVAMYEHRRTPWDFVSGGPGSGLHLTYDGGKTWKKLTHEEGLPEGDLGRMGLAIAPSNTQKIYALIEAKENGLYQSTDGGETWKLVSKNDIGDRPFYYAEIYVDPKNENRIYNLFTYLSMSEDGGKSFRNIADYGNAVHPDHHALWIHPEDQNYIIDGNDGGLNISKDGGETWRFVENLPLGQFYHVNVDDDFPYNVYGGMQDNGSWVGPSKVFKRGGIDNYQWQELYFGDGFDVLPYRGDSRYGYAMSQGGNVGYYDRKTGAVDFVKPKHPDGVKLRFNWNAPIAQDPFLDCGVYFGSQFVHYSDDCGYSWRILSGDLTTNDTTKQKQDQSGGLTIDATAAENHTTLLAIAPSPLNKEIIWTGSDDGRLHITQDGGTSWQDVYNRLPRAPKNGWIPQIHLSTYDAGAAFVVVNDYRKNNYAAYAYHTTDYGKTWKRIVNDEDVPSFVLSIIQDPQEPNLLFLGTDVGLYVSFNKGEQWQRMDQGFPHVQVSDLKIKEDDLVISTFGRSIWILDDIQPLRILAQEGAEILEEGHLIFGASHGYLLSSRSYDGIRFSAQATFKGENKSLERVNIPVWLKAKKDEKVTVKMIVTDEQGDTIRNRTFKQSAGFSTLSWGLDANNVRYPTRRSIDEEGDPSGGFPILPGKYKIALSIDSTWNDSVWTEVKLDPRLDLSESEVAAVIQEAKALNMYIDASFEAFERLKTLENNFEKLNELASMQEQHTQDSIKSWSKPLKDKIDSLKNQFMQPEGLKGIQRNPDNLTGKLGRASYYVRSGWRGVSPNDKIAVRQAREMAIDLIDAINRFIETEWKDFQKKVDETEIKLFKSVEQVPLQD